MVTTKRYGILALCFLVAIDIASGLLAQAYGSTRVTDYSPLRLSYDNLSAIVTKIQRFIVKANANEQCGSVTEDLKVDDGAVGIQLHGDYSRSAFSAAPQTAYSVEYYYDGCSEAPISSVTLRLSDSSRKLTVTGHSSDLVQALTALATEDLSRFEMIGFGGEIFRGISSIILAVIANVILLFIPTVVTTRLKKYASIGFGLAMDLSLFVCPWSKWFAGTAVYSGSASFLERNSAIISFLGLIATVVAFAVGIWLPRPNTNPPAPITPTRTAKSSKTRAK